jgi:TolB-like protein
MADERQIQEETPEPAEVRRALDDLLASETFRGSPQLAAFLRFVVEATIRGESHRIKGYTIGVEAFGRAEDFDPQVDPIVRVEATRLRRTLERYYAGPGAADPIVFDLSRGSYVPAIRRRSAADLGAAPARPIPDLPKRLPGPGTWMISLAALAVIAAAVALTALGRDDKPTRTGAAPASNSAGQSFDGPLRPGNGMPTLVIKQVGILGNPPTPTVSAAALVDKLRSAFARFDTINVATEAASRDGVAPASTRSETPAEYQLVGSGEFVDGGSVTLRFRLLDVMDGTIIWSRSFERLATSDFGAAENSVVQQLATTLLPPFGVIRANERKRHLASGVGDPRYRCVVEASESFRSFDPAQHQRARGCLESLTARDPSFAMGFAYLTGIYTREYQYGLGARIDAALLDHALRTARQSVELSPESARAYQMLFTALFVRRDIAAAFAAGDRAIVLNPYDVTILSDYGGRLIMIGELERGMDALIRAADDGAVRPSWYHFYLFLGSYLKGDMTRAAHHASQITGEANPLGHLARTLTAVAKGDPERARKAFDQLAGLRPAWRTNPRGELDRLFPAPAIAERLARDLAPAGLARAD